MRNEGYGSQSGGRTPSGSTDLRNVDAAGGRTRRFAGGLVALVPQLVKLIKDLTDLSFEGVEPVLL
jgi:hypothetical protein